MYEDTEALLRTHLSRKNVTDFRSWTISESALEGRGVFATENLHPGDIVFIDAPIVVGPRAGTRSRPVCVGCHRGFINLIACSRGCGLPVCSMKCEDNERHEFECRLLRSWRNYEICNSWSKDLLRAVTPVRCLALSPEDRTVLCSLKHHEGQEHAFEVRLLKDHVSSGPNLEDEEFMRLSCYIMDANAFETSGDENSPTIRGLYPLSSLMNHACTPNTRRFIDTHYNMVVRATNYIPAGSEVTTSYTSLLWATPARRYYLAATKHFTCNCSRCADPQEGGSMLSALKCSATPGCEGCMLCIDPLNIATNWRCNKCDGEITHKESSIVQKTLGSILNSLDRNNVNKLKQFLKSHRHFIASSNQFILEIKCNIVLLLGHIPGYSYEELSEEDLSLKEQLCYDILKVLDALQAGKCGVRGQVLHELSSCLMEKGRRFLMNDGSNKEGLQIQQEAKNFLEEAAAVFLDDATAPIRQRKVVLNVTSQ